MAAHRWWRINCLTGTMSVVALFGLTMTDTIGGATLLGSGTATAQTDQGGSHVPAAALLSSGTYWGSSAGAPQWWQYDFGSGNAFDIQQIVLGTAYGSGINVFMPTSWTLQFSDDGVSFTNVITFTPAPWVDGQPQYFFVSGNTNKFIWQVQCDAGTQGGLYALTEVAMATSMGGSDEIGSGLATASSQQATSGNTSALAAVDGNLSTFWGSNGGALPRWWQYDFGPGNDFNIVEVTITAGSGVTQYHPTQWTLRYSTDGVNFTDVQTFIPTTWVANTPQVFDVTGPPPSSGGQSFLSCGII